MSNPGFKSPSLFADLYEFAMMQAYRDEGMQADATFSVFVRRLPPARNMLVACGLGPVLDYVESLRFADDDIAYLRSLGNFSEDFLQWLRNFRFSGEIRAVPEGTPIFPGEPLLEITGRIGEGQLLETLVLNQLHLQTTLASKALRVVLAADGRAVVDFGARRMHGIDAAVNGARAFHIAGVSATSNVLAGKLYGIPVTGTMAHSYVQAHERESDAFRAFAQMYPRTILLVDTYDTISGIERVTGLARNLGEQFKVKGVRLDSGNLDALSREARMLLDRAGLYNVEIFASGGLDEYEVAQLVQARAPIDGFGVGTHMGVSSDAPDLDIAYKLTEYSGSGRLKLSTGKVILPGRKQIYRVERNSEYIRDVIAREGEQLEGIPLLRPVMRGGVRLAESWEDLDRIRHRLSGCVANLPARLRSLSPADPPYPVDISPTLKEYADQVKRKILTMNQGLTER